MRTEYEIIKRPLVTEKFTNLTSDTNTYGFEVLKDANKLDIKKAVEKLFKVKVLQVRTEIVRGKIKRIRTNMGKRSNWKKAFVKLNPGDKIPVIEGV